MYHHWYYICDGSRLSMSWNWKLIWSLGEWCCAATNATFSDTTWFYQQLNFRSLFLVNQSIVCGRFWHGKWQFHFVQMKIGSNALICKLILCENIVCLMRKCIAINLYHQSLVWNIQELSSLRRIGHACLHSSWCTTLKEWCRQRHNWHMAQSIELYLG